MRSMPGRINTVKATKSRKYNRRSGCMIPVMTHYRISEAAGLLGVSDDTVRRWVDDGLLVASSDQAGRKVIEGAELARRAQEHAARPKGPRSSPDRKSTRLNSSHVANSYAVFCLNKKSY